MTDKVQKIRNEVEKLKSNLMYGACSSQVAMETRCKEEAYNEVLSIMDSMQEETDTSVWHSKNEEPLEDKQVLIDINGFCFVDFYHKKDKRFYMCFNPHFYLHEIDKWSYVDDFLTLSNLETTEKERKEEPKKCMYSKDNYTDEDRKVLCGGCEEERCKYSKLNTMLDVALSKETKESWNKRLKEETKESVSEDLEEVIRKYEQRLEKENPATEAYDFASAIRFGANWKKEQLIANAVDATVHIDAGGYPYIPQMELYDYNKDIPLAKRGDKYKVILIKED